MPPPKKKPPIGMHWVNEPIYDYRIHEDKENWVLVDDIPEFDTELPIDNRGVRSEGKHVTQRNESQWNTFAGYTAEKYEDPQCSTTKRDRK